MSLQVNRDVEDFAADRTNELPLRIRQLVVETAEDALARVRVIVLHEPIGDSCATEIPLVVGLHEVAARVLEGARLDQQHPGQIGLDGRHGEVADGLRRSGPAGWKADTVRTRSSAAARRASRVA